MSRPAPSAPALFEQPEYYPFKFMARWTDKKKIQAQLPDLEAKIVGLPVSFRVPNPRITDERQFRDHARRTLDLKSLSVDITTMMLSTPVEDFNTRTQWDEIQEVCRAGLRDSDFEGFEFAIYTQVVPADRDIFESELVEGLDEIYDIAEDQTLVRRTFGTENHPSVDADDSEDEEGVLPVDFFPPEERDVDGFDPLDSRGNDKQRGPRRKLLAKVYAGSIATSTTSGNDSETTL
ncbi:hypothetical protein H2200_001091 [Cladophialophora chaetospira]|uniref:Uncharacterized protein n=1 Tax=Cladophialophora chaetospira TaxID=386627 RepID=A0AA38XK82_9EURO|nr:hypothetical protein H2200_001091 [Cladophialophora chaetospira]